MCVGVARMVGRLLLAAMFGLVVLGANRPAALAASAPQAGAPEEVILNNSARIHFDGVVYHANGTSTWTYTVQELPGARDLGYWVLEIPACAPILATGPVPGQIVDPDRQTNLSGVKWEVEPEFVQGQFWVRLDNHGQVGATDVAGKIGPRIFAGLIAGPTCIEDPSDPGDTLPPTLAWIAPVAENERHDVHIGDTINLVVAAADNVAVERVTIIRWDAVKGEFVTIAVDSTPPYQATIAASDLNPQWNQVSAASYDTSGNRSDWKLIWLYNNGLPASDPQPVRIFLPAVSR